MRISAPAVALALKWFRDEKSMVSFVFSDCDSVNKEYIYRGYIIYAGGPNLSTKWYDIYESAESALLDELLTLVEK